MPDMARLPLQAYSRLLNWCAWTRFANAADLRTSKYVGEDSQYYYYSRPTQADLREAARLEPKPIALPNGLVASSKPPPKITPVNRSDITIPRSSPTMFRSVIRPAPHSSRPSNSIPGSKPPGMNWLSFTTWAGMIQECAEAKSRAVNLTHTTAGHMLRYAWLAIGKTKYKTASQALMRAIDYDPADPRNCGLSGCDCAGR